MGWLFTSGQTRKELIARRTASQSDRKCLKHSCVGNVLWTVWQVTPVDGREPYRYIGCDLMQLENGYGWGYKDMDESCHPYYYTCPLSYLDMVPVACQGWRDGVIALHKRKTMNLEPGDIVGLNGCIFPAVMISEVQGRRVFCYDRAGHRYKLNRSSLSGERFETWPENT
jgi:hypothetical protein